MDKEKICVLQVLGGLQLGGAESRIMDIVRHLDKQKIEYSFLLHDAGPDFYEEEALSAGCKVYRVPRFRGYNYFEYKKALKKFFHEHPEIDIVQGHMTSTAAIYLPIAKREGVKVTVSHARSAGVDKGLKGFYTKWLRRKLSKKTDVMWACSTEAAVAVYGKDSFEKGLVRVIPNAIEIDKFRFTDELLQTGQEIRKRYGLEHAFVIGHVGRFHYAKNHEFLLEIFAEIKQQKPDAYLLLVGDGNRMEEMKRLAEMLKIRESVIFAGRQAKPQEFYSAMDMVIFPSRYEGLPGTIVEAQAAGVPSLISDAVTRDVEVTSLIKYKSLSDSAKEWATTACSHVCVGKESRIENQRLASEQLRNAGFDVKTQVKMLENLYRDMLKASRCNT